MLALGLLMGLVGTGILLSSAFSGDKWTIIINVPLCLALLAAAGVWLYFGGRFLTRRMAQVSSAAAASPPQLTESHNLQRGDGARCGSRRFGG
jgi:hypothetical protein